MCTLFSPVSAARHNVHDLQEKIHKIHKIQDTRYKEPKIKKLKMGFDWMAGFPPQLESHEVGNKPPWLKSS